MQIETLLRKVELELEVWILEHSYVDDLNCQVNNSFLGFVESVDLQSVFVETFVLDKNTKCTIFI